MTVVDAVRRVAVSIPQYTTTDQAFTYMEAEMQQWFGAEQQVWYRNESYWKSRYESEIMQRIFP